MGVEGLHQQVRRNMARSWLLLRGSQLQSPFCTSKLCRRCSASLRWIQQTALCAVKQHNPNSSSKVNMRLLLIVIATLLLSNGLRAQALGRPAPNIIEVDVKMFGYPNDSIYIACLEADECATSFRKTIWQPEPKIVSAPKAAVSVPTEVETPAIVQVKPASLALETPPLADQTSVTKPSAPKPSTRQRLRRSSQINCTPVQAMPSSGGSNQQAAKKANPQTIKE